MIYQEGPPGIDPTCCCCYFAVVVNTKTITLCAVPRILLYSTNTGTHTWESTRYVQQQYVVVSLQPYRWMLNHIHPQVPAADKTQQKNTMGAMTLRWPSKQSSINEPTAKNIHPYMYVTYSCTYTRTLLAQQYRPTNKKWPGKNIPGTWYIKRFLFLADAA